jgi:LDH2 family malate/lactate/ureidoglycolate dehydrogenase
LARLDEAALRALAERALVGLGVPERDARDTGRILVLADLFGIHTHGIARLESYGERIDMGGINARPDIRLERVAPALALLDGDNGLGPAVGLRALEAALALARESGAGVVLARNSNHFGPVAPYNAIAAEAGCASIIGSNATTTIAPTGGREARLGNSPLGFGIPHPAARPIILDMAVSVVARAKIRDALKRGATIPDTWATDREGRPTTDPRSALDGFLQPIGGHKGYGLALIVDLLAGVLSGASYLTHVESWQDAPARPQGLGHFFIAFDVARLGPPEALGRRLDDFCTILRTTPPVDATNPVKLPGEIEWARHDRARREGIEVDEALRRKLEAWAAKGA